MTRLKRPTMFWQPYSRMLLRLPLLNVHDLRAVIGPALAHAVRAAEMFVALRPDHGKLDVPRFAVHGSLDSADQPASGEQPVNDALRKVVSCVLERDRILRQAGQGEDRFLLAGRRRHQYDVAVVGYADTEKFETDGPPTADSPADSEHGAARRCEPVFTRTRFPVLVSPATGQPAERSDRRLGR